MRSISILVGMCLVTAACKNDPAPASADSDAAAASATTMSSVMPAAASPLRPGETLMGEIGREAANRPSAKPNADDAYAAITKAGVTMGERKQSMGATYKAAYCNGGYTTDGALAVNVCEYASEADATAGRDFAKTMFPNLKTREVWSHKTITLTVIQQKTDDAAKAEEKKIVDAFNAS